MGDNSNTLQTTLETLAASLKSLQASVEANSLAIQRLHKAQQPPSSSSSGPRFGSGEHHQDRPPRFQQMDFPKYDGKSDPLAFINRCESYFLQQRIMEEEKVWMASSNFEAGAHLWYIRVQRDEGTPPWRRFTELLHLRFGPSPAPAPPPPRHQHQGILPSPQRLGLPAPPPTAPPGPASTTAAPSSTPHQFQHHNILLSPQCLALPTPSPPTTSGPSPITSSPASTTIEGRQQLQLLRKEKLPDTLLDHPALNHTAMITAVLHGDYIHGGADVVHTPSGPAVPSRGSVLGAEKQLLDGYPSSTRVHLPWGYEGLESWPPPDHHSSRASCLRRREEMSWVGSTVHAVNSNRAQILGKI